MVMDVDERCKDLGIDPDARFTAERKVSKAISELWWDEATIHFEELHKILNEDELLAYIRWNKLDKRFPELFTWDGRRN